MSAQSNNYMFRKLDWDTAFFGIECARVDFYSEINKAEYSTLLNQAKPFDFISINNHGNIPAINRWVGRHTKAQLVDINVQLEKKISNNRIEDNTAIRIQNNLPYNKEIVQIAGKAYTISKFITDTELKKRNGNQVYLQWVINSFNQVDKFFLTYQLDNHIVGYILYTIESNTAIIELIAVSKDAQKKQVGSKMIRQLEKELFQKKIEILRVGTQLDNVNALSFYHHNGFDVKENAVTYHWWRKHLE